MNIEQYALLYIGSDDTGRKSLLDNSAVSHPCLLWNRAPPGGDKLLLLYMGPLIIINESVCC